MKKNSEVERCLSTPRELCKSCYNWLTQEDVGFNDLPQCSEAKSECRSYLLGYKDTCNRYCNI